MISEVAGGSPPRNQPSVCAPAVEDAANFRLGSPAVVGFGPTTGRSARVGEGHPTADLPNFGQGWKPDLRRGTYKVASPVGEDKHAILRDVQPECVVPGEA